MKYINLAFLFLSMSLITGCSDDNERFTLPGSGDALSVKYRIEGEMSLSRGIVATGHEIELDQVHILFFDGDTEAYSGYTQSPVVAGKPTFSVEPPETLTADKSYKVLAIGNGDKYIDNTSESLSAKLASLSGTLGDIKKKLIAYYDGNVTAKSVTALPLFGTFLDKDGNESMFTVINDGGVLKVRESESAEFLFSRAICRVDIHNLVGHILDIRYARIANNRTSGYYFADGLIGEKIAEMNTAITDPSQSDLYMPITTDMAEGSTTQRLETSLYTFPNIVATTVQNDKVTTCLIIAGYYIDPESGEKDEKLTFYRFNLANMGESQTLQRNYAYRATIKGVKRRGADNESDAYKDSTPIFEYDVDDEWDTTGGNVVSDEDGNFLIVNKTHFTFNGEASEADFVELRVSTNPQLKWHVETVNRDNQDNDKFRFEKISDSAAQCGPKAQNTTEYVRYGYFKIVATSETIKKPLEIEIHLVQLSTKDNVKMLSVNGNTGEFTQEISPDGGNVSLKVLTGSKYNNWEATEPNNLISFWSTDAFYTKNGTHNGDLTINIPANIGETKRETDIIVNLSPADENVPPVKIHVVQDPTTRWFSISPDPGTGVTIDASSLDFGSRYANGVCPGTSRGFTVTLKNPNYKYKVTTTFDKLRDLRLSANNDYEGNTEQLSKPMVSVGNSGIPSKDITGTNSNLTPYINATTNLSSGTKFYLNPFRMGPGDPAITGTVTVTAYNPTNPSATSEAASLTFNVTIKAFDEYSLNDVIIGDLLVADRNIGHSSRVRLDTNNDPVGGSEGRLDALNYHYTYPGNQAESILAGGKLYIQRGAGNEVSEMNDLWNDRSVIYKSDECTGNFSSNFTNYINYLFDFWYRKHEDSEHLYSPFYTKNTEWRLPLQSEWQKVLERAIFTKWRVFIASEVPTIKNGKEVPTVCWLHQTDGQAVGQGYHIYTPYLYQKKENPLSTFTQDDLRAYFLNSEDQNSFKTTDYNVNYASVRPVHKLTQEELASYKTQYLGY